MGLKCGGSPREGKHNGIRDENKIIDSTLNTECVVLDVNCRSIRFDECMSKRMLFLGSYWQHHSFTPDSLLGIKNVSIDFH